MSRKQQRSLFEKPPSRALRPSDPSLNLMGRLKAAMRQTADESRFSREEIVDRMNQLAEAEGILARRGRKFTLAQVEGWMAGSKNNLPDAEALALFCAGAEGNLPLAVLAGGLGAAVIDESRVKVLEWAENELAIRQLTRRRKQLEPEV